MSLIFSKRNFQKNNYPTLRSGFFVTTCGPSETGRMKDVLSTEAGVFVDRVVKLMASARKQGLFLAVKGKLTALARKRGVFMAAKVADPKETPSKGCLCNMYTVTRRFSAASSASARCSQNIEAAGTLSDPAAAGCCAAKVHWTVC